MKDLNSPLGWFFEPRGRLGGASGETVTNAVAAGGLTQEDLLVREAIQNACDAALPVQSASGGSREEVRVVFRLKTFQGNCLDDFIEAAKLDELHRRATSLEGSIPDAYDKWLDDSEKLNVLYIEDYGTSGLGGRLDRPDKDSHFAKLIYEVGCAAKARSNETFGGSYGLGKGAHSRASALRCFFVHTVIEPFVAQGSLALAGEVGQNQWSRFQGVCHFPSHEYNGRIWTGRGFFGLKSQDYSAPIPNDDASELAKRFGFQPRKREQRGTSVAIIGSNLSIQDLQRAVEDWWWPRLFQHTLEVELIDETSPEKKFFYPRPLLRRELIPYIRCFDAASGDFFRNSDELSAPELKPIAGMPAGKLAIAALSPDDHDEVNAQIRFRDSIALIRGSRMVIGYRPVGSRGGMPAAATYVASESLDSTLMLSEPVTHHEWDPSSDRLPSGMNEVVSTLLNRLDRHLRRFQQSLTTQSVRTAERAVQLERQLSEMLSYGARRIVLPRLASLPSAQNISRVLSTFESAEPFQRPDGSWVTEGLIKLDLIAEASDCKHIQLSLRAFSVANDRLIRMDPIPLLIYEGPHKSPDSALIVQIRAILCAGESLEIPIRIGPHLKDVRLRVSIEGQESTPE